MKEKFLEITNLFLRKAKKIDFKYYAAAGVILLLLIGMFIHYTNNSKSYFLKSIEKAIENNDYKKIQNIALLDDEDIKEQRDVKPFIEYFSNEELKKDLIESLESKEKYGDSIKILKDSGFFGSKYKLSFKSKNLKLTSTLDDTNMYLNGKLTGKVDKESKKVEIKNLVPGKYTVKGEIQNSNFSFQKSDEITVMDDDTSYEIKIQGIKVTVNTPYKDGMIYINGVESKIKAKDFKEIGPFPVDGSVKLSLEHEFPWGKIKSSEVTIRELPIINIELKMENDKFKESVNECATNFYNSVFEALNKESKDSIKNATNEVKDKIFNILKEKYFILKNNYNVLDVETNLTQSEFVYKDGSYSGNLVVNVDYSVTQNIFGIQLSEKKYSKNFFTHVKYENGNWIVGDIDNFTLNLE